MAHNHNNEGVGKTIAGFAALAAAAAGVYFLYGSKNAEKNRKNVKGWMLKMKGEVLERMEELKDVSEDVYYRVIDEVKEKYENIAHVGKKEANEVADEMKSHWKSIKKDLSDGGKKTIKKSKKVVARKDEE